MNYIVVTATRDYWGRASGSWLPSVLMHRPIGWGVVVFGVDFQPELPQEDDVYAVYVDRDVLGLYPKGIPWQNRPDYVSQEGGSFLRFFDFQDDDLIIDTDSDVTMQRSFTDEELGFVESLDGNTHAMEYGAHPEPMILATHERPWISTPPARALCPGHNECGMYNAGVHVARASAWRELNEWFREAYPQAINEPPCHIAIGQWLISWFVQKRSNLVRLPEGFHITNWAPRKGLVWRGDQYYLNGGLVLFAHHQFNRVPRFT